MSLSAWEQQALDSIKDGLASSDPTLAARLAIFTRLASDEEMPAREKIQVGSRRAMAAPDGAGWTNTWVGRGECCSCCGW